MASGTATTPEETGRAQLILRGGTVIDGSGAARRRADVAVEGSRIAAVGELSGRRITRGVPSSSIRTTLGRPRPLTA